MSWILKRRFAALGGATLSTGALALILASGCVETVSDDDGNTTADRERSTTERQSALVGPEVIPSVFTGGNTTCGDLFPDDPDMIECKIEPVVDGTYNNATGLPFTTNSDCDDLNIVLDVYQDADGNNLFDWTSNIGIDGVFAKAQGGNFYWYTNPGDLAAPGEIKADDGLHAPANPSGKYPALSHVSFCWDPDPDLKVTKVAADPTISAGDVASFTITVENHGEANAYDVDLSDTLPTTTGGWTLGGADAGDCSIVSDLLTCEFGTLAPGDTRVITVSTTTTADECGALNNMVTVSASNEPDDLLTDNTDNDSITVDCPDVTVLKTAVDDEITIDEGDLDGETVAFNIVVTNNGPGSAYDVTLTDTLPGTGWVVSGTDAADCDIVVGTNDELTCDFGTLADDASKSITVSRTATRPDDCGTLPNTAVVEASNEDDDDTGNNESSDTITVDCPVVAGDDDEGCTPGYWKQEHHFDSWMSYSPSDELGTIFNLAAYPAYVDVTLIEALIGPSPMTQLDQLLRHAVAALLNATSSGVDYPYTAAQVIAMTNAALASGDFEGTKDLFEMANELGCFLD